VHPKAGGPLAWPVTGPSRLGPAQPTWAELDPTPKKLKIKKIYVCIKINLFYLFIQ